MAENSLTFEEAQARAKNEGRELSDIELAQYGKTNPPVLDEEDGDLPIDPAEVPEERELAVVPLAERLAEEFTQMNLEAVGEHKFNHAIVYSLAANAIRDHGEVDEKILDAFEDQYIKAPDWEGPGWIKARSMVLDALEEQAS